MSSRSKRWRRRAQGALIGPIVLAGCISSFALDRKKAADYQRRYVPDCQLLSDDVARAQPASRERQANPAAASGSGQAALGRISKKVIRRGIEAHLDEVRACYTEALEAWRTLHGLIKVRFVIAPDGSVIEAVPVYDSSGVPALGCCIARVVRAWEFPPPDGGGMIIVQYPFLLEVH